MHVFNNGSRGTNAEIRTNPNNSHELILRCDLTPNLHLVKTSHKPAINYNLI